MLLDDLQPAPHWIRFTVSGFSRRDLAEGVG
jgi:hypothetical protein